MNEEGSTAAVYGSRHTCTLGFTHVSADAAEKAKAEGLSSLNLGQKIRAFMGALQPAYWQALSVVCLLYFARFDASFITLRARTVRLSVCRFLGLCNPKHTQDVYFLFCTVHVFTKYGMRHHLCSQDSVCVCLFNPYTGFIP